MLEDKNYRDLVKKDLEKIRQQEQEIQSKIQQEMERDRLLA